MADDLKPAAQTIAPELREERPLARVQAVPWLIVIVLLAAIAWLGWRAFFYQEEGDPVGSAMLAFEKQNSLTVFSCLLYTSPSPRDRTRSRMPSSA